MEKRIKDTIPELIKRLNAEKDKGKTAFLGFDACIDSIVKIVNGKDGNNVSSFFSTATQFGEFLISLENKSCGMELQTRLSKIGGNMVITSNALGNLGVRSECVGTFGDPDMLPVFHNMSANCTLHTIADTINATALEFNNSKVIMFDPGPYNKLTWDDVTSKVSVDKLIQLIEGKQLVALVNWSEIENSSLIWSGLLKDVISHLKHKGNKTQFFTDFSDCSRKSKNDILTALGLLKEFRRYYNVSLSLNQNEAELVSSALDISTNQEDQMLIKELYSRCNADILIIHRVNDAIAFNGSQFENCPTFFCSEPKILTGGGDNFNAGFCYALLCGLDLYPSLLLANAVSGSYVKNGISPDINTLSQFLAAYQR